MKTTISLIALTALLAAGSAYAAQTYSGTGAGRGGFVNSTGFVKERGNDPEDKMGKDDDQSDDSDADKDSDDVPAPDTATEKQ